MSTEIASETTASIGLTELERNALARAERLKQLRAQSAPTDAAGAAAAGDNEQNGDEKPSGPLIFRSYQPINKLENSVERKIPIEEKFDVVDRRITQMLDDTHDASTIGNELDLNILAPKKVDWDLKRGIQPKLDLLDKRTEKAISQLIRKRLAEGDEQLLPAAINSALKAQNASIENDENDGGFEN